jgi:hypothetical protein
MRCTDAVHCCSELMPSMWDSDLPARAMTFVHSINMMASYPTLCRPLPGQREGRQAIRTTVHHLLQAGMQALV